MSSDINNPEQWEPCMIIPTGNVRWIALSIAAQNAPKKLQMEFRNYDDTHLEWRDVPTIYVDYNEFFGVKP